MLQTNRTRVCRNRDRADDLSGRLRGVVRLTDADGQYRITVPSRGKEARRRLIRPRSTRASAGQFVAHVAMLPGKPLRRTHALNRHSGHERWSATCSSASSPMPAIAATMP
jgi:hypothetical protein